MSLIDKEWYTLKKLISSLFIIFVLSGCGAKLSQSEAETLVIKEKSNHLGKARVIETKKEMDFYLVQWENQENKRKGVTKVDQHGDLTIVEEEIE